MPNPLLYSVFEGCPLNLGVVNLHALKLSLGGMGLQGGRICPDWFRFLPFFCIPCFLEFVPIYSDFGSDLFSAEIRTNQGNPFLLTPFASHRLNISS